jgi:phosphoribosylformylglycinamidine synthase PurS subunit
MKAKVHVTLKNGVLDPQGKAIAHALGNLGFTGIGEVELDVLALTYLAETNRAKAEAAVRQMCEKLLANTVIENYAIELTD